MELLELLFAALFLLIASALSNGNLALCNVDMAIGAGTNIMKWVQAPVPSSMYMITSPATSYKPGAMTPITIQVLDLDYQYIGLVLVADSNETAVNVGQWYVLDGDDFFLPATCKFRAVVHSNANLKPLEQSFYWKGTAGLGSVTFRALIKQGEQNHGYFFRPPSLILTEAAAVAPQTVWKSAPGGSCAEACGEKSMSCDQAATLSLNSPTNLQTKVQDFYNCRAPYLKTCGPPATGTNSYCYYYDCTLPQTWNITKTCTRRVSDPAMNQQFCACKPGAAVRDPLPPPAFNTTIGFRLASPMQLDAELRINSLEIMNGDVTVDITGPQDRWFAIGWDASVMAGTYATVVWLNDPSIGRPQNYDSIADKGFIDSAQGWYDARCQQALNDFCRNVGYPTKYFSCALANTTYQFTSQYNANNNMTFSANFTSRVPCKGGEPAPFLPMTVAEYILGDFPRNARLLDSTITPIRSFVDNGQFRISFSRSITGPNPFPTEAAFPLSGVWAFNNILATLLLEDLSSMRKNLKRK